MLALRERLTELNGLVEPEACPRGRTAEQPPLSTPLHLAARRTDAKAVAALVAAGADKDVPGEDGETPLCVAAESGHTGVVKALLEAGANTEATCRGHTPLHLATRGGHAGAVRALLAAGARREAQTPDGQTALDLARSARSRLGLGSGRKDLVELLQGP